MKPEQSRKQDCVKRSPKIRRQSEAAQRGSRLLLTDVPVTHLTLHAGQIISSSAKTALNTSSLPLPTAEFRTVLLSLKISSADAAVEADKIFLTCRVAEGVDV